MRGLAVIWRAAGLLMATGAESVVEVLPPVAWRRAPGVPAWVRGLFACRGRLIPLVDAAVLLGAAAPPDRMANRVLVLRAGAEGAPLDWHVGLWVEGVLDLEHIDFEAEGGHPGFAADEARFLGPVAPTRFGPVQLVRTGTLFTPEQVALLTQRLAEAAA